MKIRLTKSFLYSLLLHGTIVLLVVALFMVSKREENAADEKRCKIMLTQVCECPPEKRADKPPVVKKQKKPQPKREEVKKEALPVVKEEVVVQELPEVKEEVVEEEVVLKEETVENEELVEELMVASDAEAALSSQAQEAIATPQAEEITPEDAYVKAHIAEIMALLRKNLYYPRMARKRGIEGKVFVRFELMPNGEIKNITVTESGREILASAAVTTIERLEGKFPLPEEMLVLHVPIMYQLH